LETALAAAEPGKTAAATVASERTTVLPTSPGQPSVAAVGGRLTHHNASAQVFAVEHGTSRFVWIADLLPHEMAPAITAMIEQGLATIKRTLERGDGRG
jgi:predicted fused transcriptional regulator/phosphomethylpyrimidine kinase